MKCIDFRLSYNINVFVLPEQEEGRFRPIAAFCLLVTCPEREKDEGRRK